MEMFNSNSYNSNNNNESIRYIKPLQVNVRFLNPLKTSENLWFFIFAGVLEGNSGMNWVKQNLNVIFAFI